MRGARGILLALLLVAGAASADLPRPESSDALLGMMRDAVAATGKASDLRIDPVAHQLHLTWQGVTLVANPDNLFLMMQAATSGAERQEYLDRFVASLDQAAQGDVAPLDPATLLPILRPELFAKDTAEGRQVVSAPWIADLSLYLVEDSPSTTAYVTPERLAGAGLEFEAAQAIALRNLERMSPRLVPLEPGRYGLSLDGTYESSLVLDSELWRRRAEDWGTVLMVMPARDTVMIARQEDAETVAALRDFARERFRASAYPVSDAVFRWHEGGWVTLP